MHLSGQEGGLFVEAEGVITVFICWHFLYKPAGFEKYTLFQVELTFEKYNSLWGFLMGI